MKIFQKPIYTISDNGMKKVAKLGNISGWEQRGVLGITAIVSQPFIDYNNKSVDKKTRKYSTAKTIVKIVVGTMVGMAARYATVRHAKSMVKKGILKLPFEETAKKSTEQIKEFFKTEAGEKLFNSDKTKKYINTAGTLLGVLLTLVTNFAIDMPLTKWGTNMMAEKFNVGGNNE